MQSDPPFTMYVCFAVKSCLHTNISFWLNHLYWLSFVPHVCGCLSLNVRESLPLINHPPQRCDVNSRWVWHVDRLSETVPVSLRGFCFWCSTFLCDSSVAYENANDLMIKTENGSSPFPKINSSHIHAICWAIQCSSSQTVKEDKRATFELVVDCTK